MSLTRKTSYDGNMKDENTGHNEALKKKMGGKTFEKKPIIGTKYTIAISSAKGGVGKSTFAMNFALALKSIGLKVGILDADIYGPSLPKMMSISEKPKSEDGKSMEPINQYGLQCMSIGFLVDEETPMIWRGPMVISAIKTLTQRVLWKDLDLNSDDDVQKYDATSKLRSVHPSAVIIPFQVAYSKI